MAGRDDDDDCRDSNMYFYYCTLRRNFSHERKRRRHRAVTTQIFFVLMMQDKRYAILCAIKCTARLHAHAPHDASGLPRHFGPHTIRDNARLTRKAQHYDSLRL